MDARRLSYLRALGIDVWRLRESGSPASIEEAPSETTCKTGAGLPEPSVSAPELRQTARPRVVDASAGLDVAAMDWDSLRQSVLACTRCGLHESRTQGVFGVGNPRARWMIIGEAPGADEDRQGEPFVGRAGQLLNSMLRAMGLARESVFIANILKSRPPGNRDPRPEETRACLPYLFRQIELIDPTLLLCVGRIAAQTLLETDQPIGKLRGRLHQLASGRPMVVTYHPAYLLRSPGEKRKAWADLVLAMQTFERLTHSAA